MLSITTGTTDYSPGMYEMVDGAMKCAPRRGGSLEVGKFADIVACRANPLNDIEELTRLAFAMKGETAYRNERARP